MLTFRRARHIAILVYPAGGSPADRRRCCLRRRRCPAADRSGARLHADEPGRAAILTARVPGQGLGHYVHLRDMWRHVPPLNGQDGWPPGPPWSRFRTEGAVSFHHRGPSAGHPGGAQALCRGTRRAGHRAGQFLTGTPAEIRAVAKDYGVYYRKTSRGDVDHTFLTSLVDADGILRVQYLGVRFDPNELLRDLQTLVREGQRR